MCGNPEANGSDLYYLIIFIFFEMFVFNIDKPCKADPHRCPHTGSAFLIGYHRNTLQIIQHIGRMQSHYFADDKYRRTG